MKTIQIDQDLRTLLASKAQSEGESPSSILRRELAIAPALVTLDIDDDVYSYLVGRAADVGESASSILRRELKLGVVVAHEHTIVEFHIPRGIGPAAWNTREHPVVATVGDTLRIFNDDSVPRRLHTTGSPFPHPADDILPGQAGDFLLLTPFDPARNQFLHDHVHGPTAQFWIRVQA